MQVVEVLRRMQANGAERIGGVADWRRPWYSRRRRRRRLLWTLGAVVGLLLVAVLVRYLPWSERDG